MFSSIGLGLTAIPQDNMFLFQLNPLLQKLAALNFYEKK
jgi:hypothetical protein